MRANGEIERTNKEDNSEYSSSDEEISLPIILKYKIVQSYISVINKLWAHQTSRGLHTAPFLQSVTFAALKQSFIRGQHACLRVKLVDCGKGTIKDGYTAAQISDLIDAAWAIRQSKSIEPSLRIWLDFLLGNLMLLRFSNCLSLKLPNLFALPLSTKGQQIDNWCLVVAMSQGKFASTFFIFVILFYFKFICCVYYVKQVKQISIGGLNTVQLSTIEIIDLGLLVFWRSTYSGAGIFLVKPFLVSEPVQIGITLSFLRDYATILQKNCVTQQLLLGQLAFIKRLESGFQNQLMLAESMGRRLPSLMV